MTDSIVHIITTLERGGAENQLKILIQEQLRHGHNIICIPLKGKPELDHILTESGAIVETKFRNKKIPVQIFELYKLLNSGNFVLHAHLPRAELIGAAASCLSRNQKFVVSRHNAEPFYPSAPNLISKILSRFVTRISKNVIFISEAVKIYCLSNSEISEKASSQVVLYGYKKENCNISQEESFNFEKLINFVREGYLLIGTVARLEKQKDLRTLINAFNNSLTRNKKLKLVIVGEGSQRQELTDYVNELGIEENVIFYGRSHCVTNVMKTFKVFVLSSIYEGFGLVLLEAASSNVPIIAANNSAIPEVTGRDYLGLFETSNILKLSAQLDLFINKSEYAEKSVKHMTTRLELFDAKKMESNVDSVYESMAMN
jgi:glycosyltransferase involved in cell wall biosynthesis